jgi:hypothetical protein
MLARSCPNCGATVEAGQSFCRMCGSAIAGAPAVDAGGQPLAQFDVAYPERLSRWLIFVKWLLAIPHYVVLYLYGFAASILTIIAWFAILFTGRIPRGIFDFIVGYLRWSANVSAYYLLLRDEYPPFSPADGLYPVHFSLAYPARLSRWKIFLKWLLVIPNIVVLYFIALAAFVCTVIAWFAILFTGRYPPGLFTFVVGTLRWSTRVNTYVWLLTDRYPPFTTAALPGGPAPQMMPA